jgi:hypothetical protein
MKTTFLAIFLLLFSNPSITEVRKLYATANNSESIAKEFAVKLNEVSKEDNKTLVAYKGASLALLSKLANRVSEKMKKFKEGAGLIEYAVASEPNNIEIRMIRLSVQENVPMIVNYRGKKKEDKKFLLDHYKEQTEAMKIYIGDFISQSKTFTQTEKQSIK